MQKRISSSQNLETLIQVSGGLSTQFLFLDAALKHELAKVFCRKGQFGKAIPLFEYGRRAI